MSLSEPHITVIGDAWQYVPFGRARIKALCATGLSYASQTFVINGATIKVRISGTQSFIIAISSGSMYMESGQLEWSYPSELNPDRNEPAKWHFMDIGTSDAYLGKIGAKGVQANLPALVENQDSLAIGYPKKVTGTGGDIAAANAQTALDYSNATIMKKMVTAVFPASLFTGKMRLFMQAQYGAKEVVKPVLQLSLVGTAPILEYVDSANELRLQFGFWGHKTPGIFSAPDGSYWLLDITAGVNKFIVTAYPIASTLGYAGVKGLAGTEKTKAEAYLFANCTIKIKQAVIVGEHPITGGGGPLAYGWKFNKTGNIAKIVLNDVITPESINRHYYSKTVTLTFDMKESVVTMMGVTTNHGAWIDGWGTFNIFGPDTEIATAPLSLISQSVGVPKATQFSFSGIPIYGYFVDDEWVPVTMSTTASIDLVTKNIYRDGVYLAPISQYEIILCGASWAKADIATSAGSSSTITVGGYTYTGEARTGTISEVVSTVDDSPTNGGWAAVNGNFTQPARGYGGEYAAMGLPIGRGWDAYNATGAIYIPGRGGPYPASANYIERIFLPATRVMTTGAGAACKAWTLVIPGGDCEAVNVAKSEYFYYTGAGAVTTQVGSVPGPDAVWGWGGSPDETFVAYCYWWGEASADGAMSSTISITYSSGGTGKQTYGLKCFNAALNGVEGTPGGSLYALFNVSYAYQYYDRGMYSYTSFGKRYVLSEGLKYPDSAYSGNRFVGWA